MAFEDAATFALTLSRIYRPNPMADVHTNAPILSRQQMLERWCKHRQDRAGKVLAYTTRNMRLMETSDSWSGQQVKDWATWGLLKVQGPEAGAEWLYGYHCENVLGALV
jgi:hypothetical protein